tara:strand:+ start:1809 stop:2006 length:198 start_codon:yes stop_codon:yes gene_type:complete
MAKITIEIETDNEAFGNDRIFEVKRIIDANLEKIKTADHVVLHDLNGNKVGYIKDWWEDKYKVEV